MKEKLLKQINKLKGELAIIKKFNIDNNSNGITELVCNSECRQIQRLIDTLEILIGDNTKKSLDFDINLMGLEELG